MLRLPPFDKIGVQPIPDCVNADPTNGQPGSILNMLMFNILQHEGENLALAAGLTPSGTDLTQWMQAVSRGGVWCGPLTGTGDLAVATLPVTLPALLQGMRVGAVAQAANTVTNPKLRLANYGSVGLTQDFPIVKMDGSALAVGDIKPGRLYRFEADGAGNVMISGGGISAGAGASAAPIEIFKTALTANQAINQNGPFQAILWPAATCSFGTYDAGSGQFTFTKACKARALASASYGTVVTGATYLNSQLRTIVVATGEILGQKQDQQFLPTAYTYKTDQLDYTPQVKTFAVGDVVRVEASVSAQANFDHSGIYGASPNVAFLAIELLQLL